MNDLVDREREVQELRALAGDGRRLALLYGRRRIGKTFLLTRAWEPPARVLYFTASATAPEVNRRALLQEAGAWSGEELPAEDYPTWRTVFRAVFGLVPEEPVVVVLDEFQYLATGDAGLREVASELNAVWEGKLTRGGGLLVVLAGSAVHTLAALEAGGSPLFGRLDWRHRLAPFDYLDAGRMVERYGLRDRVLTYAAFGGTPLYLDAVDDRRSVAENIIVLLLAPDGRVRIQVETALEQEEGLRETARYRAILATVGLKRRTVGEIAAALGQPADSPLKRMVKELVRLEYLEEGRNFEAPGNQAFRYRLADPAQRFYYGLVLPNESAVASAGASAVWEERLAGEAWPAYVGQQVFEDVVPQAYARRAREADVPAIGEWGRWEGLDRNRDPVEIDVVARLLDGPMLTGSAKFRQRAAGPSVFIDHVTALQRLASSGQGWAREALETKSPFLFVSAGGFTDSFRELAVEQRDRRVILWTLDELFRTDV